MQEAQQVKAEIMDEKGMARAETRISYEIVERNHGLSQVCVIGIRRRGAVLARHIAGRLAAIEGVAVPTGFLDITPWRDDLGGARPTASERDDILFSVTGQRVVLVDDVLFTGRSVRAAIDAIMHKGRPQRVQLAVLVDRGHRELPISPDFVGKNVPTSLNETVAVHVTEYDNENRVLILGEARPAAMPLERRCKS